MVLGKKEKRRYEKQILPKILKCKDFLICHLQKEWKVMEQKTKQEDLVRSVKAGGKAFGKGLLLFALLAGTITVAAVAPNVIVAFGPLAKKRTYFHRRQFEKELAYCRKRKYIRIIKEGENEYKIALSDIGGKQALRRAFGEIKISIPEKWDGIWRIVISDIPEKQKAAREGIRERLKAMGFYPLQKSVFVFPYPCQEEIEFLTLIYNIGANLRFIETSTLINDNDIRKWFSL